MRRAPKRPRLRVVTPKWVENHLPQTELQTHRPDEQPGTYRLHIPSLYPAVAPHSRYALTETHYDALREHLSQTPSPQSIHLPPHTLTLTKVKPPRSDWTWGVKCLQCEAPTTDISYHQGKSRWLCLQCAPPTDPAPAHHASRATLTQLLSAEKVLRVPEHRSPSVRMVMLAQRLRAVRKADRDLLARAAGPARHLEALQERVEREALLDAQGQDGHNSASDEDAAPPGVARYHRILAARASRAVGAEDTVREQIEGTSWPTQIDLDSRHKTYTA